MVADSSNRDGGHSPGSWAASKLKLVFLFIAAVFVGLMNEASLLKPSTFGTEQTRFAEIF